MMKSMCCDLCGTGEARIYCESDQARLCWTCDDAVHAANFLVAKHPRCLLCNVCSSPTPWTASGRSIGRAVSVCDGCCRSNGSRSSKGVGSTAEDEVVANEVGARSVIVNDEVMEDEFEDEEDCGEGDEDEDDENQVVPWTETAAATTSSSSEGEEERSGSEAVKRRRTMVDSDHDDDDDDDDEDDDEITAAMAERHKGCGLQETVVKRYRFGSWDC